MFSTCIFELSFSSYPTFWGTFLWSSLREGHWGKNRGSFSFGTYLNKTGHDTVPYKVASTCLSRTTFFVDIYIYIYTCIYCLIRRFLRHIVHIVEYFSLFMIASVLFREKTHVFLLGIGGAFHDMYVMKAQSVFKRHVLTWCSRGFRFRSTKTSKNIGFKSEFFENKKWKRIMNTLCHFF